MSAPKAFGVSLLSRAIWVSSLSWTQRSQPRNVRQGRQKCAP